MHPRGLLIKRTKRFVCREPALQAGSSLLSALQFKQSFDAYLLVCSATQYIRAAYHVLIPYDTHAAQQTQPKPTFTSVRLILQS